MTTPTSTSTSDLTFKPINISKEEQNILSFPFPSIDVTVNQTKGKWLSVFETQCSFRDEFFIQVMNNLLLNPNITSSFLFRAEIFYDSEKDKSIFDQPWDWPNSTLLKAIKSSNYPQTYTGTLHSTSLKLVRTVVRNLIPRNSQLDKSLVQTVHFLQNTRDPDNIETIVVQIPHVNDIDEVPFYHPKVQTIYLKHSFNLLTKEGSLSIHYCLFPHTSMTERTQRTAMNILKIIHKHSVGRQNGYQKRVHHDQIISQKRFQDTYARLKAKHAKWLINAWVEVTDPQKHVFEDLGIAAFLIELWKDMYGMNLPLINNFPGFVDIGCGNGVLVYILIKEGYSGWGFDIRERKSWDIFPDYVRKSLKEFILIPEILTKDQSSYEEVKNTLASPIHNGKFDSGTFIISNHADQLTPWTPLLASLSDCPFLAIPCCSHGLSGKIKRYSDIQPTIVSNSDSQESLPKSASPLLAVSSSSSAALSTTTVITSKSSKSKSIPGEATSNSNSTLNLNKQPSAYAGFSAHIMNLTLAAGYQSVEKEVLRIPSTRNLCIIGRKLKDDIDVETKWSNIHDCIENDAGSIAICSNDWMKELSKLQGIKSKYISKSH